MSESKFTKGEWKAKAGERGYTIKSGDKSIAYVQEKFFGESQMPTSEFKGNTRLICAAPELFAACEEALDAIEALQTELARAAKIPKWLDTDSNNTFEKCKSAILKAKGEK